MVEVLCVLLWGHARWLSPKQNTPNIYHKQMNNGAGPNSWSISSFLPSCLKLALCVFSTPSQRLCKFEDLSLMTSGRWIQMPSLYWCIYVISTCPLSKGGHDCKICLMVTLRTPSKATATMVTVKTNANVSVSSDTWIITPLPNQTRSAQPPSLDLQDQQLSTQSFKSKCIRYWLWFVYPLRVPRQEVSQSHLCAIYVSWMLLQFTTV